MPDKCPYCGFNVSPFDKTCPSCGISMSEYAPDQMRCPLCKTIYPGGTKFCLKDGSTLESGDVDFSSEATMFLTPQAMKKMSDPKKPEPHDIDKKAETPRPFSSHPSDKDRIPITSSYIKDNKHIKPADEKPSQPDDAFELFEALTGSKSQPPAAPPHSSAEKKPAGVQSSGDSDEGTDDLFKSLMSDFEKKHSGEKQQVVKSKVEPAKQDTPLPKRPDATHSPHSMMEMSPELLEAKRKLEEKYANKKPLSKQFNQPKPKTLADYDRILAKEDGDDLPPKPEPRRVKQEVPRLGFWERIKMAFRVIFPKK